MTSFVKANFRYKAKYLIYVDTDGRELFVARLRNKGESKTFVDFLVDNFTFEEYFRALWSGNMDLGAASIDVLRQKGYISVGQRRLLEQRV